jgi:hypothetical protein
MARPSGFSNGFSNGFGQFSSKAEIMIAVGDSADPGGYKDGDIVAAFNHKRIRGVNAEHICWSRDGQGKKKGGFLPTDIILEFFLSKVYQYKFQRIGVDTATRTNLVTMEVDNISKTSTNVELKMDVAEYVNRRLASSKKPIFGSHGLEVWYGGHVVADGPRLDDIWAQIEILTSNREENNIRWPITEREKKKFLVISVDEFDDGEAQALVESEMVYVDPDNTETASVGKKRKRYIEWRKLPDVVEADVLNGSVAVDIRGRKNVRQTHVKIK